MSWPATRALCEAIVPRVRMLRCQQTCWPEQAAGVHAHSPCHIRACNTCVQAQAHLPGGGGKGGGGHHTMLVTMQKGCTGLLLQVGSTPGSHAGT